MEINLEDYIKFRKYKDTWWNKGGLRRTVNQNEITAYITKFPGKTESQIMENLYNFTRYPGENNKKYADCLRRALRSRKICRCLCKPKNGGRKVFVYFIPN